MMESAYAKGSYIYIFPNYQQVVQSREDAAQFCYEVRTDHLLIIHPEPSYLPSLVKEIRYSARTLMRYFQLNTLTQQ